MTPSEREAILKAADLMARTMILDLERQLAVKVQELKDAEELIKDAESRLRKFGEWR